MCNENPIPCKYPCTEDGSKCKLFIRKNDCYGKNSLQEKIKLKFIDQLLIYGIENRDKIVEEKINLNNIRNLVKILLNYNLSNSFVKSANSISFSCKV